MTNNFKYVYINIMFSWKNSYMHSNTRKIANKMLGTREYILSYIHTHEYKKHKKSHINYTHTYND